MSAGEVHRLEATVRRAEGRAPAWDLDLRVGRAAEGLLADYLRSASLAEVKHDRIAQVTRRLYVEYEQELANGDWVPSGIATSEADLWAFQVTPDGVFILVPADRLLTVARRCWASGKRTVGGSEGHRSLGALVGLRDLLVDLEEVD